MANKDIIPGRYRHYKGQYYSVLGTAIHSETEETMVIYRSDYGDKRHWVRPLEMFIERLTVDGQNIARFKLMEASE